jgi:glycosyltransferase involved in cell wall biosynthesis
MKLPDTASRVPSGDRLTLAVVWIDWYPYHLARFRALAEHPLLKGKLAGIEMVGGCGVHPNQRFRAEDRGDLPVLTLQESGWYEAGQRRTAVRLWRTLDELSPAAVLIPGYYTLPGLAAALWCRLRRRRSVLMTETTRADHRRFWWRERPKQILLRLLFDFAIAGGKAHVRYLEELGFPLDRVAKYYDVVDNAFYQTEAAALRNRYSPTDFGLPRAYFLYVGRLASEKGLDSLLHAFKRYREQSGRLNLAIVGGGPQRNELEKLRRTLGLEHCVVLPGHKNSSELIAWYAFAECFILPSRREPWGLVTNEAMAAGLPVIVSNRCGCAEDLVVEGYNGYTFDPADPDALTSTMLHFTQPSDVRTPMGMASQRIVATYSPENWASEVARIVYA